jgi:2-keto-4-pentenoate hydratase
MANTSTANSAKEPDRGAAHRIAAERLIDAARLGVPCAPVREILPDGDLDDGYEVQRIVHERTGSGRNRVGRKIGLTSPAVQRQMGVDTPDFGVLYADMAYGDSMPIPHGRLLQPRVEAEVAFVLAADLPERTVTIADVLRVTDFVVAAIEVVDSRIENWDISIFDTVADNASSGAFVLGGAPRSLRDLDDLRDARMTLTKGTTVVSSGTGAACMGHPVNAVVWLANVLAARGEPLRAGEIVLSGSLGALVPAEPDASYEASISGLGSVRAVFTSGA